MQRDAAWVGARRGWVTQRGQYCKHASWQSLSRPRSGKGTQTGSSISVRHSCQKAWDGFVRNGQQAKQIERSFFFILGNGKQLRSQSVQYKLMAQSPKTGQAGAPLSSKVWPWSMKTVQSIQSQPPASDSGNRSSHTPLDCLKSWQSDHTCHHPHTLS